MQPDKKLVLGVAGMLILVLIGGLVSFSLLRGIQQPSTGGVNQNLTTADSTSTEGIGLVLVAIGVVVGCMTIIIWLGRDREAFERLNRLGRFIYSLVEYAVWGAAGVLVILGPGVLIYYAAQSAAANSDSMLVLLKWVGILLLGFMALAGLGYVNKKYGLGKVLDNYRAHKGM